MRVLLIGPGGVGKTTVGRVLAHKLGLKLLDLDHEFCERIDKIPSFLKTHCYEEYLVRNAELCAALITSNADGLFVLSSGFLSTDTRQDLVESNRKLVASSGISVLLLPSEDLATATPIVVERQLGRGFGLKRETETAKFAARFNDYLQLGNIKIFGTDTPKAIASLIEERLYSYKS